MKERFLKKLNYIFVGASSQGRYQFMEQQPSSNDNKYAALELFGASQQQNAFGGQANQQSKQLKFQTTYINTNKQSIHKGPQSLTLSTFE